MLHSKRICALLLLSVVFISPCLAQDKSASTPPGMRHGGLPVGSKMPDFNKQTLNGKEITLSDYRGQYVLLDFWGTWCQPCLWETPYLKEAYKKHGDTIKFIGIAADNIKQHVIEYVDKNDIEWPQIVVPYPSEMLSRYNIVKYPSMFLIDPEGDILMGPEKGGRMLRGLNLVKTLDNISDK